MTIQNDTDCSNRDKMFNDVYFYSNLSYNIGCFLIGFIGDWSGNVLVRIISFALMISGMLLMSFVEDVETLLWIGWPCLAVGGVINHMSNIKNIRAIPGISASLMTIVAGCFSAGGSVTLVMDQIRKSQDLSIKYIFFIWTGITILIGLIKVFFQIISKGTLLGVNTTFIL